MTTTLTSSVTGKISLTEFNEVIWTIDGFCSIHKNAIEPLLSPIFSMNYCDQIAHLQVQFHPKGCNIAGKRRNLIYLHNRNEFNVTIDCRFSYLNSEGTPVCKLEENQSKTIRSGDSLRILLCTDKQNNILNTEQLIILCLIKPAITSISRSPTDEEQQEIGKDAHSIRIAALDDFENLYINGTLSDVIVSTADDEHFYLHKCILASRSTVFKAMFNNEMGESDQNSIVIEDFSSETMKELFRFMYTGKVEQIEEVADDLYRAAHKYWVKDLMTMCETILCQHLNLGNVIDYLVLADLYDAENLKTEAIKFVVSHGKNIVHKLEFEILINKNIACEIFRFIFPKD